MNIINDGGPAFPRPIGNNGRPNFEDSEVSHEQEGMSLRDYFAAKAMQAEVITSCSDATPESAEALLGAAAQAGRSPVEQIAFNAYQLADAMLKARSVAEGSQR